MKIKTIRTALFAAITLPVSVSFASTTLTADGTDTYKLIESKLNSVIESPDCAHADFGKHITQEYDSDLKKQVFVFHTHVKPDNDRCLKDDRQRNEIKVDANSPSSQKALKGDKMNYRWKFKLDSGFLTSPDFSHLHQVKPVGGDDDNPLITIIARGTSVELTHYNYSNSRKVLKTAPLSGFLGEWVEVNEKITANRPGTYSVTITRVRDKAVLLSYSSSSIDMWRSGNTYVRPKWGLYRSLNRSSYLRDEKVRFDSFCIAKGSETCGADSGTTTPPPVSPPADSGTPAKFMIGSSAVSASAHDGNVPANTVDGKTSTRWSANGDGQWIRYDLQALKTVSFVKVAWHSGSSRKSGFEVQVSSDGRTFTTVMNGQSSGSTTALETYDFTDVQARYVRIIGHGNTSNTWNSITETQIHGLQ